MIGITKRTPLVVVALLTMAVMGTAQTQRQGLTMSVQGYPGEAAPLVQLQGRSFVDIQDLARMTNGALSFEGNRIILTLPRSDGSEPAGGDAAKSGFSRAFMKAAIEAMASMREWGGMLLVTVQNGYPVGKTGVGNTIMVFQGRTADGIALAAAAASTDSDQRGLELLRNEFNNVKEWADTFIKARNSMSAVNQTTSENLLRDDPQAQNILLCGQFLAQMFAGGTFQDDAACH